MLIWITAPYAAIGVLASFVLLLSTVVSEQIDLNATTENIAHITATQEELDSVLLMDLPFSRSLKNPCSWDGPYNGPNRFNLLVPRDKFMEEFYTFVSHYSKIYREDIQEMLQNHSIAGCADLHVGNLPHTPTLAELKEMNREEALNKIYLSLLIHSAYLFVVHHEVNSTNIRCSNDIQGERSLANQSYIMALKQKALSCYVLVGMAVLGCEREDVTPHFNVNITDLSLCSRRALRDCQVLNSAKKFLGILQIYAADALSDLSTSFSSSTTSTSPIYSTLQTVSTASASSTLPIISSTPSTISPSPVSSISSTISTASTTSTLPITSSTPSTISPSTVSSISSTLSTSSSTSNSLASSSSTTSTILNILTSSTLSTSLSASTVTSTASTSTTGTTDF